MAQTSDALVCRGCGTPVGLGTKKCPACGSLIEVTSYTNNSQGTFRDAARMVKAGKQSSAAAADSCDYQKAQGHAFFQEGDFQAAAQHFSKAREIDSIDPDLPFKLAICRIRTRPLYKFTPNEAKEVLSLLDAAITLAGNPIYCAIKAHVIVEVFEKRYLKPPTSSKEVLANVALTDLDKTYIKQFLGA